MEEKYIRVITIMDDASADEEELAIVKQEDLKDLLKRGLALYKDSQDWFEHEPTKALWEIDQGEQQYVATYCCNDRYSYLEVDDDGNIRSASEIENIKEQRRQEKAAREAEYAEMQRIIAANEAADERRAEQWRANEGWLPTANAFDAFCRKYVAAHNNKTKGLVRAAQEAFPDNTVDYGSDGWGDNGIYIIAKDEKSSARKRCYFYN